MKSIIEEAEIAFNSVHESFCLQLDMKQCELNHHDLIKRLKDYEKNLEKRIKGEIAAELENARDFMVLTKEPEENTAAMWIKFAFDKAIGFADGAK